MTPMTCSRTKELAEVLKAGHAVSAWDAGLREHVEGCRECGDFVLVQQTLQAARAATMKSAPLGSPGLLWWRAQLRRRNEAMERLSKPTSIAGRLAFVSTALVAVVLLVWQASQGDQWLRWISDVRGSTNFHLDSFWSATSSWSVLLPIAMIGALALLGGFAVYLATDLKRSH